MVFIFNFLIYLILFFFFNIIFVLFLLFKLLCNYCFVIKILVFNIFFQKIKFRWKTLNKELRCKIFSKQKKHNFKGFLKSKYISKNIKNTLWWSLSDSFKGCKSNLDLQKNKILNNSCFIVIVYKLSICLLWIIL